MSGYGRVVDAERVDPVAVPCQEYDVELAGDAPELRLELSCDDDEPQSRLS